jgi:hypothetical protein
MILQSIIIKKLEFKTCIKERKKIDNFRLKFMFNKLEFFNPQYT